MALGDEVDRDYRYLIGELVVGRGTPWLVTSIEGLDLPPVDYADEDRPEADGGYEGRPLLRPRTIVVELALRTDDVDELEAERNRAGALLQPSERPIPFVWRRPARSPMLAWVQVRRVSAPIEPLGSYYEHLLTVELRAADPLAYGIVERTATVGMVATTDGVGFPWTFPLAFTDEEGPLGDTGRVSIVNEGAYPTIPSIRLTGPYRSASVENVTTGQRIALVEGIGADTFVDLDLRNRTALLAGTADRRWWLDDRHDSTLVLAPGANDLRFVGDTYDEDASMLVVWRDAYTL